MKIIYIFMSFIQVPTAKFRTWSQRRFFPDVVSYDYLLIRAEMVSDISSKRKRAHEAA